MERHRRRLIAIGLVLSIAALVLLILPSRMGDSIHSRLPKLSVADLPSLPKWPTSGAGPRLKDAFGKNAAGFDWLRTKHVIVLYVVDVFWFWLTCSGDSFCVYGLWWPRGILTSQHPREHRV
jgi:hypothetical protein